MNSVNTQNKKATMKAIIMYRNRTQCVLKSRTPFIVAYTRYVSPSKTRCLITYTRDICSHCATDCSNNFHHFELIDFIEQELDESHKEVADQLFIKEAEEIAVSDIELLNLLNDF